MNWKKTISISMTFLLTGGLVFNMQTPVVSDAKSISESLSYSTSTIKTFSSLDSKENDTSSRSAVDPATNPDSTESGSESGSSSSGSGSDSSGGGHSGSSDSTSSEHSTHSGNEESSASSETTSDSETSGSGEGSSSSGDSSTDDSKQESEKPSKTQNTNDKKKTDAKKDTKTPEKKVEKDDSNGRDYQESEIISSGNTSFTIVSVVREDKELEKKLKELRKKKKEQEKELASYEKELKSYTKQIEDIQNIYNMISQTDLSFKNGELYLTGYKKEFCIYDNKNCLKGMDSALYNLACKYNNTALLSWLEIYSTERSPFPEGYTQIDPGSELISNADSLLQEMLDPCTNWIVENQPSIDDLANGLEDTKEHIEKLEAAKKASTIEIDSRLLEYKDKIPDQCVEFLNSIVAKEGTPYVWGASGPNSFDCSGLVSYGLRQCNAVSSGFRWTSIDFATQLRSIPFSEALPGDLVWKKGHIAVYIDENTVFEAPYTGAHIRFTSCDVSSRFSRVLRWWSE